MHDLMDIIICRANEVEGLVDDRGVSAVLSIEHPGAIQGKGLAPRLEGIDQKILCFWDVEEDGVKDGPSISHIEESFNFLENHKDKGVIIHCHAGKSRSVALALAWKAAEIGIEAAIEYIKEARPVAAPNLAIIRCADDYLGMGGALELAVLNDTGFSKNRARAEARRAEQRLNPDMLQAEAPEKAPPPSFDL